MRKTFHVPTILPAQAVASCLVQTAGLVTSSVTKCFVRDGETRRLGEKWSVSRDGDWVHFRRKGRSLPSDIFFMKTILYKEKRL